MSPSSVPPRILAVIIAGAIFALFAPIVAAIGAYAFLHIRELGTPLQQLLAALAVLITSLLACSVLVIPMIAMLAARQLPETIPGTRVHALTSALLAARGQAPATPTATATATATTMPPGDAAHHAIHPPQEATAVSDPSQEDAASAAEDPLHSRSEPTA